MKRLSIFILTMFQNLEFLHSQRFRFNLIEAAPIQKGMSGAEKVKEKDARTGRNQFLKLFGYKNIIYFTFVVLNHSLFANPSGHHVIAGEVSVASKQSHMSITTGDKSIIEWKHFSNLPSESIQFLMPNGNAFVLNRVVGNEQSSLLGTLTANGNVYLVNPNGIFIGKDAVINTASFLASTFDVLDSEFLEGDCQTFFPGNLDNVSVITNKGKIKTSKGDVTIISRYIDNQGSIEASNGSVFFGAGEEVLFQPNKNERIFIRTQGGSAAKKFQTAVCNSGSIQGSSVAVKVDGSLYDLAMDSTGSIQALSARVEGGKIFLISENGTINLEGRIAAHYSEKQEGGTVHLLADKINTQEIEIDASGKNGGGTILVGGDYQGNNPQIWNASQTHIGVNSKINASATQHGDGGRVIIWSEDKTSFMGDIVAQGGQEKGDGGFVEISSKSDLFYRGKVDTTAPFGKTGTLLFDPYDFTVSTSATSGAGSAPNYVSTAPSAVLNNNDLETALGANNVTIKTVGTPGAQAGDIHVTAPVSFPGGSSNNLTLEAAGSIIIDGDGYIQTDHSNTNPHEVKLIANSSSGTIRLGRSDFTGGDGNIGNLVGQNGSSSTSRATITLDAHAVEIYGSNPRSSLTGEIVSVTTHGVSGDFTLTGGPGNNASAQIEAGNQSFGGTAVDLNIAGDLNVTAGDGNNGLAGIMSDGPAGIRVVVGNDCHLKGGNGGQSIAGIFNRSGQSSSLDVTVSNNLILEGGASSSLGPAVIFHTEGPIQVNAGNCEIIGGGSNGFNSAGIGFIDIGGGLPVLKGDISVSVSNDLTMRSSSNTNNAAIATSLSSPFPPTPGEGTVTIICGINFDLQSGAVDSGATDSTTIIVVDQNSPAPVVGPGAFSMAASNTEIKASSPPDPNPNGYGVNIYSSRLSQDTVGATQINGETYDLNNPDLFQDGVFYNSPPPAPVFPVSSNTFKFYYKESNNPPPPPPAPLPMTPAEAALLTHDIVKANFELFNSLAFQPFDFEYLYLLPLLNGQEAR